MSSSVEFMYLSPPSLPSVAAGAVHAKVMILIPSVYVMLLILLFFLCFFFVFDSLRPSQHFFSYVGTGLPGLNQY